MCVSCRPGHKTRVGQSEKFFSDFFYVEESILVVYNRSTYSLEDYPD